MPMPCSYSPYQFNPPSLADSLRANFALNFVFVVIGYRFVRQDSIEYKYEYEYENEKETYYLLKVNEFGHWAVRLASGEKASSLLLGAGITLAVLPGPTKRVDWSRVRRKGRQYDIQQE